MSDAPDEYQHPGGDSGPRLKTVGDIQREMARVYRGMRTGRVPIADGNGLTQTLQYLTKVTQVALELEALEKLDRLEKQRAEQARVDHQAH